MGLEIHNLPERGNTSVRTQPAQMCSVIVPTYNRSEQLGACLSSQYWSRKSPRDLLAFADDD